MLTMHRPDADPSAEIYTFDRSALPTASKDPSIYPVLMAQFSLLPLQEDVQVDLDMRPDPPFPTGKGPNALGPSKPFTDHPEEGVLVFNMTVMTATAEEFTHIVMVASKLGMLQLARERYKKCANWAEANYLSGGRGNREEEASREYMKLEWELWGSIYTRIFEDNTLGVNWVGRPILEMRNVRDRLVDRLRTSQVCFVHGYRYARLSRMTEEPVQRPRLGPYQIEVLDFSPIATYNMRQRDHGATHRLEDGTEQSLVSRLSILNNQYLFRRTIMSSLPYVITTTGKRYLTEGVMLGDSSLIISRVSRLRRGDCESPRLMTRRLAGGGIR